MSTPAPELRAQLVAIMTSTITGVDWSHALWGVESAADAVLAVPAIAAGQKALETLAAIQVDTMERAASACRNVMTARSTDWFEWVPLFLDAVGDRLRAADQSTPAPKEGRRCPRCGTALPAGALHACDAGSSTEPEKP